ncbi:bifunctional DNA primase/polymerase [Streptomyces olivaceus]|uniref:bifunctional DNA primase/polymerase n=1 Tax=Streptomyces olivaceus TaxID=47716 RepID=UPI001CCCCD52|nr:bifunctional DNA primase/polymerase [Streptomyces olivaceus]MBZ6135741.1 bifunctional DNA primase/polymerase [Streptomyces olivaceus]
MTDTQPTDLRASARELHDAGLCVLPIKADGSKKPVVSWLQYKVTRSTPAEHDSWFSGSKPRGLAVVYGAVSGNVEMIEFEGRALELLDEVTEVMEASGLGDAWAALLNGWVTESPSGGLHCRVRIEGGDVPGSAKLASRLAEEHEYTDEERQRLREKPNSRIIRVLIETRGEGGYGLVEPSGGTVHASGKPYLRKAGGPTSIPSLPADVVDAIRTVCRMFDTLPVPEAPKTAPKPQAPLPDGGVRPGEDFEGRADWTDILRSVLRPLTSRGHTTYWGWADGVGGVKATTGRDPEKDRLWVFATGSEFQADVPYSKFGAYTLLEHGGNFKAAAAELRRKGYGTEPPRRRLSSVPAQHFADGSSALDADHTPDPQEGFEGGPQLRSVPSRPELDITNEADAIDGVLALMKDGLLPDLYTRSGGPCWVYRDDNDDPIVQQLGTDNMRAYLADHVSSFTVKRNPLTEQLEEERELLMPKSCSTILGRKTWPLPILRGVVTSPVIRRDGTLLDSLGYDRATGLFLEPRVPLRRLAPQVTRDSLDRAKDIVLDQVLKDFPWVAASDRAHFLGALLTPILRPYFDGPTPMFVLTATAAGSGKSLLKDIFRHCYGIADTAWPENDTELRKSITTQLYGTGQPVVVLDNLPNGYVIKSPVLSALLTSEVWGDRVLGATSKVTMPNDRLWIVTGNALRTGGDNGRRVLWVRLDPDCPDPDQRDNFTVGDLRPWLRNNASTLVAALVTLVRAWVAVGAPQVRVRKGDYSEWASLMAGLLDFLGVDGWLADRSEARDQDDELQEWALFLEMWRETYGSEPLATGALIKGLPNHVPRKGDEPPSANQLGIWLKARQGRYFGTHKVVMVVDSHRKQNLWRVEVHADRGTGGHES